MKWQWIFVSYFRITDFSVYSSPKEVKSLYIDTTFCVPAALFIPSREESSNAVIAIAEEWISQSRNHMIVIKYKALLGYEDLFRRLAEHFSTKVCVDPTILNFNCLYAFLQKSPNNI